MDARPTAFTTCAIKASTINPELAVVKAF